MKKLLFVLALGAFAACGSGESTEETTTDTATVALAPAITDTAAAPITDTAAKPATDTAAAH